ncbi:DUF1048 domain-containing protein [Agromyces sp. NPDC058104]|uniref:DUF1048 domain-containing protein n=1 Tax=Agromyces sp. NPDC058104 TaxID=3346342 RepID=UPI0036DC8686
MSIIESPRSTAGDVREQRPTDPAVDHLPTDFRAAFDAFAAYLAQCLDVSGERALGATLDDLAACLEQAHADGRSVGEFAGDDPAAVVDALRAHHTAGRESARLRAELRRAIDAIGPADG